MAFVARVPGVAFLSFCARFVVSVAVSSSVVLSCACGAFLGCLWEYYARTLPKLRACVDYGITGEKRVKIGVFMGSNPCWGSEVF